MKCTTQKSGAKIITSKYNRSGLATALLKYKEEIMFKKDGKNEIKSTASKKSLYCAQFILSKRKMFLKGKPTAQLILL